MPDLQSSGGNIVFLNDNGDSLYDIPLDLVTQLNKVPFGIGQTSLNENISLSGTDNSLLLGDSITVASGKTITLNDSSTLNVLSNADIQRATGIQQRTYEAGEIVQVKFKRIDEITSMGTSASDADMVASDHTDFGRLRAALPLHIDITPKFSNSLIKLTARIYGESTHHNSGWLIGEYNSTEKLYQVIRRTGFEGYNNARSIDQQSTYISDLYDGDNNSTPRHSNFAYYDKPGTTSRKGYCIIFTSTADNTDYAFRLNRTANTSGGSVQASGYEIGVSTLEIMEIKQ